ncbi:unnamed protein product, partial [Durusdinium trenchii]
DVLSPDLRGSSALRSPPWRARGRARAVLLAVAPGLVEGGRRGHRGLATWSGGRLRALRR